MGHFAVNFAHGTFMFHRRLIGRNQPGRALMQSLKLLAATALIATTMAAPAMARNYCDTHRCYHHRGPVGAAADTAGAAVGAAAGIAGAAIGTAGAIATAPFGGPYYGNSYGYNHPYGSYAYDPYGPGNPNGFVCRPGTWFKGADGRQHPCQ
jgi:hypothetical protein